MAADTYIAKVFKQHNSLVIVVPHVVCIALNVKSGQYLVLTWLQSEGAFKVTKFKLEGEKEDGSKGHTDKSDKGGRT